MAQQLKRGPYLQVATPSSIVVRWRTDQPTDSKINFGLAENQLNNVVQEAGQRTEHQLVINNLQPNTVYFYSVGNATTTLQAGKDNYFKTAPVIGSTQKIRLWAMGDMGNNSQNQRDVADQYLKQINNDNRQTDGVILLGDNAYGIGTDQEFQDNFFNVYQDKFLKNNVVWPSAGNHEYYSGNQQLRNVAYFQLFSMPTNGQAGGVPSGTNMYYSYDCANVHVVSLDSYGIEDGKFRMSDTLGPQIQWLKRDLAANKQPWTIVFFHHPPYTKNSHDSDLEGELALIRQFVTPILERYKVDLVLSGHSHIYERSALMRGHKGFSNTFSTNRHVVNTANGRYDGTPNSCAYVNKSEGTIYAVVGSSGQMAGRSDPPHPSSVYANVVVGGSLMIEVENNRLDAKWIAADGLIRDQFTLFKNVNKTINLTANFGSKLNLNASWKGTYNWSNGEKSKPNIEPQIVSDTTFTVRDERGCLLDRFEIKLANKPSVTVANLPSVVCQNTKIPVSFNVTNTATDQWTYTVQLSDANGNFGNPANLGSSRTTNVEITIPATIPVGDGYRLRVVANSTGFAYVPSATFAIKQPATAAISGQQTINIGERADLRVQFTGSAPWSYQISGGNAETTSTNPLIINLKPTQSSTYSLTSVSNVCGNGTITGAPRITVIPRLSAGRLPNATVCGGSKAQLSFVLEGNFEKTVAYTAQLSDQSGAFAAPTTVGSGAISPLAITIPDNLPSGKGYRLRVVADATATTIAGADTLNIRSLATATLAGNATVNFGQETALTLTFTGDAPWNYALSDGRTGTTSISPLIINVKPTISTTYSLATFSNVCSVGTTTGTPRITVIPRLTTGRLPNVTVCGGSRAQLPFVLEGNFEKTVAYTAQLSDQSGTFTTPVAVGNGAVSPLAITIPSNLPSGKGYRLRVVADATAATIAGADTLNIRPLATAALAGNATVNFGQETALTLTFTGDAPWNYSLSDGRTGTTSASPVTILVKPVQTTNYTLTAASNACGSAATSGSALVNILILSNSLKFDELVKVSPNPTANALHFQIQLPQPQNISWQLLDTKGAVLQQENAAKTSSYQADFELSSYPSGTYFLRVWLGDKYVTKKIIKK